MLITRAVEYVFDIKITYPQLLEFLLETQGLNQSLKVIKHFCFNFNSTFWKKQNYRDRKLISGAKGWEGREECCEGHQGTSGYEDTVLCLNCSGAYMTVCTFQSTLIKLYTNKGECY